MEPDIRNGLMITGHYSSSRDDTEYYDVYAYPSLVYLFRYNSSRFNNTGHIHEHYPKHDEYGFLPVGELKIWRDLYPCLNQNGYYLERICWGILNALLIMVLRHWTGVIQLPIILVHLKKL